MIALLGIVALTAIIPIKFEIQRDQELEMIHRGVQYSRAIRTYYKKFGRYPTKIEDLESANNLRFLRKRYKDPITGQDFKLLHFGEAKLTLGGIGGAGIAGASSIGANGALTGGATGGGFSQPSAFGGNGGFGPPTGPPTAETGNLENPYGTSLEYSAPVNPKSSDLNNYLPNACSIVNYGFGGIPGVCASTPNTEATNNGQPISLGVYDRKNKLPYTINYTFDMQWQPRPDEGIYCTEMRLR